MNEAENGYWHSRSLYFHGSFIVDVVKIVQCGILILMPISASKNGFSACAALRKEMHNLLLFDMNWPWPVGT